MPSKQIEFEKSGNNYAYHQEWLDEAKLTRLLTCENEGRPFFFAVHGAMVIEKGAKLIKQVFYHPSEVVSDTDKLTGCHPYINKNGICHFAWENSYSAASLDALRLASRYDFSLSEYAQAVDISLNKLYQKNDVKFAVGESVGSLVLMDAVAQRIKNGQKVPETLFLINFAVGGLCPGAQVWLESTGQFQGRIVPALLDLLPNSPYLESLISKISEVKAGFPNIVAISCDIGSEAAASPMWLTHDKALVERARKVGFTGGGDGMFNGPGSKLIVNGKYLVDHERLALYVFKGATHKDGYDCGQFVMKELIRNGGMPNNPHHGYAEYLDYSWRLAQDPFYSKKELLTKFLLSIIEKNHRS